MHAHHAVGVVGDEHEPVDDAVEARCPTRRHVVALVEMILLAELSPVFVLLLGQHQDDVQLAVVLSKSPDGAHQDGHAAHWQELLGHAGTHAQPLASCQDDGIVAHACHIIRESIRCR